MNLATPEVARKAICFLVLWKNKCEVSEGGTIEQDEDSVALHRERPALYNQIITATMTNNKTTKTCRGARHVHDVFHETATPRSLMTSAVAQQDLQLATIAITAIPHLPSTLVSSPPNSETPRDKRTPLSNLQALAKTRACSTRSSAVNLHAPKSEAVAHQHSVVVLGIAV